MPYLENNLQKQVLTRLKKVKHLWVHKVSDRWISGIPDLLLCYHGRFIAIELKVPGKKATRLQNHVLKEIHKAGGRVYECHSVEEVMACLK